MKISVIVPVYNMEKKLRRCLDSLINQTLREIEIIVINDGSKDGSLNIIKSYAQNNSNIVIIDRENRGISASRNEGIEHANGKYIGFVDSDDYVELNMFEQLYNVIENNSADIVVCNYKIFNENNSSVIYEEVTSKTDINTFKKNPRMVNDIHYMPWNKLYKRELFDCVTFPINTKYEDLSTIIKVFSKANKIVPCKEFLYNYLLNENGETLTIDERIFDIIDILNDIVIYFKNSDSSKQFNDELEKLCVSKIMMYKTLSYGLKNKHKILEFSFKSLKFLDSNFENWRNNYKFKTKKLKEKIMNIINRNDRLSSIFIQIKFMGKE